MRATPKPPSYEERTLNGISTQKKKHSRPVSNTDSKHSETCKHTLQQRLVLCLASTLLCCTVYCVLYQRILPYASTIPPLYPARLHSSLPCSTRLHSTLPYSTRTNSTLPCSTRLHSTLSYSIRISSTLLSSTRLNSIILCSTRLSSALPCSARIYPANSVVGAEKPYVALTGQTALSIVMCSSA